MKVKELDKKVHTALIKYCIYQSNLQCGLQT